jgi:hypothetical protein
MTVPKTIDKIFAVVEYGFFPHAALPKGYVPPRDGGPPLQPIQNLAICKVPGVDGYYLLYCTPAWKCVTSSYHDTIRCAKKDPAIEFGRDVICWHRARQSQ